MQSPVTHFYVFGPFRLNVEERQLVRDGESVQLPPKTFEILLLLASNSGRVLEKGYLIDTIWPDTFVEEAALAQHVFKLRRLLGEGISGTTYIQTVPRIGYRFVAEVKEEWEQVEKAVVQNPALKASLETVEPGPASEGPVSSAISTPAERARKLPSWSNRWVLATSGLLIAGLLIGFIVVQRNLRGSKQVDGTDRVKSVAVLPLETLGSPEDEYLGLGISDALVSNLLQFKHLRVCPMAETRRVARVNPEPVSAGRLLGADAVIQGNVQKLGDRIRVSVRMLDVQDGRMIWSDTYNEKLTSTSQLQDTISKQILTSLTVGSSFSEQQLLQRRYTPNTEAFQDYLKGRFQWTKWTRAGFEKSLDFYKKAIEEDPHFALAYTGLADAYNTLAFYSYISPEVAMPGAKAAALTAIELDNSLAEAHGVLAEVYFFYDWNWPEAEREFETAIQLSPGDASLHHAYGSFLVAMASFDRAAAEMKLALHLDPLSPLIATSVGYPPYFGRQYDESIPEYRKAIDLDPTFPLPHSALADVYCEKGMYSQAIQEYQRAIELSGRQPNALAYLGRAYALDGKKEDALKILSELDSISQKSYVSPVAFAIVYIGLGDADKALAHLDKAFMEHSNKLVYLKVQPTFDVLRQDPRFVRLLEHVGF